MEILGCTALEEGSVRNTIPSHIHDRRMEAYLYWGMTPEARVLHRQQAWHCRRHQGVGE